MLRVDRSAEKLSAGQRQRENPQPGPARRVPCRNRLCVELHTENCSQENVYTQVGRTAALQRQGPAVLHGKWAAGLQCVRHASSQADVPARLAKTQVGAPEVDKTGDEILRQAVQLKPGVVAMVMCE